MNWENLRRYQNTWFCYDGCRSAKYGVSNTTQIMLSLAGGFNTKNTWVQGMQLHRVGYLYTYCSLSFLYKNIFFVNFLGSFYVRLHQSYKEIMISEKMSSLKNL